MNKTKPWFVTERAMAIAYLLLTKRRDIHIRQKSAENGDAIDMIVEVRQAGKETLRFFGVQVNGSTSLPSAVETGEATSFPFTLAEDYSTVSLPLCAFVIDVRKNQAFYSWIVEPTVEKREPRLTLHDECHFERLDASSINAIVKKVNRWYDVQQASSEA